MNTPTSTYRLQITPDFTLFDAAEVIPRLERLGVGAVYLSPLLTSTTGSVHGYDWVDCRQVDPQRGGEEGWNHFVKAARAADLPIVLDIVPNHTGIAKPEENPFWWDVLQHGRESQYAEWFDIDWASGPILVPVLPADGSTEGLEIVDGELHFFEHRFPTAPGTEDGSPDEVAGRQHYRLAAYPLADSELNYRRFFAVNELAGLRIEDEAVFEATHERIFTMVDAGELAGIRVDHPDGLTDPAQYFQRLRARVGQDMWILGEKILEDGELVPSDWGIQGTTGYDAMAEITMALSAPSVATTLDEAYREATGDHLTIEQAILAGKQFVVRTLFGSEVTRIGRTLPEALRTEQTAQALQELAARVPAYRTYLPEHREALGVAMARTRADLPELDATLDQLEPILGDVEQEAARRFQQLSGAVMAKGVEDTAWYRSTRFIGANEVGGHPAHASCTVEQFHTLQQRRLEHNALSMTSLSTHDTKRGEDTRAWLLAISQHVEAYLDWYRAFSAASTITDPTFNWFIAQTLVAAGDHSTERLHEYATKAMREASTFTTWTNPDEQAEQRVLDSIDLARTDPDARAALQAVREVTWHSARQGALVAKVIALTMPGIPDLYQGTEIWEDSLVDPDNRRPVDAEAITALLDRAPDAPPALDDNGALKLFVVARLLRLRKERPEAFGGYQPVSVEGPDAEAIIAYDRGGVIVVVPRLDRPDAWPDQQITLEGPCTDLFTGTTHEAGPVSVSALFAQAPASVLVKQ